MECERWACHGVQLRAFVQSQEAGHLAGLQEVEGVRSGRGSRPIALHALQFLRPLTAGHNVQLYILRLLLIEQYLRNREKSFRDFHLVKRDQRRHKQNVFIWNYSNRKLTRQPQGFQSPTIVFFFPFLARFSPDLCQLDKTDVWLHEITRNLISTAPKNMMHISTVWLMFAENKGCFFKISGVRMKMNLYHFNSEVRKTNLRPKSNQFPIL